MKKIIEQHICEHIEIMQTLRDQSERIETMARMLIACLQGGNKVCFFGNGGSAADSQHLAEEFVGRFKRERKSLPALSLAADSAALTCIANDYGYENVFSRQVEGLCQEGDVVVGLSTSGTSPNVVQALRKAKEMHLQTIGFFGSKKIPLLEVVDTYFQAPTEITHRIQECHLFVGHILCDLIDRKFSI